MKYKRENKFTTMTKTKVDTSVLYPWLLRQQSGHFKYTSTYTEHKPGDPASVKVAGRPLSAPDGGAAGFA